MPVWSGTSYGHNRISRSAARCVQLWHCELSALRNIWPIVSSKNYENLFKGALRNHQKRATSNLQKQGEILFMNLHSEPWIVRWKWNFFFSRIHSCDSDAPQCPEVIGVAADQSSGEVRNGCVNQAIILSNEVKVIWITVTVLFSSCLMSPCIWLDRIGSSIQSSLIQLPATKRFCSFWCIFQ